MAQLIFVNFQTVHSVERLKINSHQILVGRQKTEICQKTLLKIRKPSFFFEIKVDLDVKEALKITKICFN